MDQFTVAAHTGTFGSRRSRVSEDAYYRRHEGRPSHRSSIAPVLAVIGVCLAAAIGLVAA